MIDQDYELSAFMDFSVEHEEKTWEIICANIGGYTLGTDFDKALFDNVDIDDDVDATNVDTIKVQAFEDVEVYTIEAIDTENEAPAVNLCYLNSPPEPENPQDAKPSVPEPQLGMYNIIFHSHLKIFFLTNA